MKALLTETEFDRLPDQTQMFYLYCPDCKMFYYSKNNIPHLCGDGVMYQRDIDTIIKDYCQSDIAIVTNTPERLFVPQKCKECCCNHCNEQGVTCKMCNDCECCKTFCPLCLPHE
jgi:hypothetical protein